MSPVSPYSPDLAFEKSGKAKGKIAPLKLKGKGTVKSTKTIKKGKKEKKITDAFWWSSI